MAARYGRKKDDPNVKLSKYLSYLLRHGAEKEGLKFQDGGFVYVSDILALEKGCGYTEEDVARVVLTNDKQRFFMEKEPGTNRQRIRANQGHSVQVTGLDLTLITDPDDFPIVLHGTYRRNWDSIRKQGLKVMGRTHIHFAAGEPGADGIISGMRSSCDLLIFINLKKALEDGIKFWLSANGVILSEGNSENVIPRKYFQLVTDRRTGQPVQ